MIKKNGLTLKMEFDGSFTCADLAQIPQTFTERYTVGDVWGIIEKFIGCLREGAGATGFATDEERNAISKEQRKALGREHLDGVVADLKSGMTTSNLFETFLFWFGEWYYYHPTLRGGVGFDRSILEFRTEILTQVFVDILLQSVKASVRGMELVNVANAYGHFALLFTDRDGHTRRIVTDTQLFELRGVCGYVYLDVTPEGKPIARSRCNRGGGRAFFDGVRLMGHERFETCAPKTIIVDGGYKVNSTRCTIVNGMLFELIDVDDKVAQTTGAFFGLCDFNRKDQVEALALAQESGNRMKVSGSRVVLDGKELNAIGIFAPSRVTLLDSGFTLCDWSDFHEFDQS